MATRHRHRFEARGGRRLFTKLADGSPEREDLRREAEVLGLLDRRLPATALLAPACVEWREEDGALHLEALEGADLSRRVTETGLLDVRVSTALGTALAVLHEEGRPHADEWPGDARSAPVGVHRPTPADNHRYSAGALDVLVLLQRSAPLCAHLDRLCVPPSRETLIHGDVRLENVIAASASGPRLVDWEFAGAGEGLWDVACFVASCLGAWLWSIPQIPAVSPERLVNEATLPLAAIRPGLGAFWTAYEARSQIDPAAGLGRCIDLAAVRLVQLAVEAAAETEDLRAVSVMHLQVALNMLERPAAASPELLGLPLRMAEDRSITQVAEAIEALEVLGPTRYAWMGEAYDLPEPVLRLAPPEGLRAALVHAMQLRLYADFFTAGGPTPPPPREILSPDATFARALSAANAGTVRTEPGWRFVGVDAGRMIVERLGLHLWAEPDEVVHEGPGPPREGDQVAVRMPSDAPNFSPGFYFVLSDRGLDPDRPRLLDRYYLHIRAEVAVRCVELVTTRLNAADLPFRLKVVDDPRNFGRCDTAVLTLQRKDRPVALDHVHELRGLLGSGLKASVPALTLRLAPGLELRGGPRGDGQLRRPPLPADRGGPGRGARGRAHGPRRPDGVRAGAHGAREHDPRGAVPGPHDRG